MRFLSLFSGIDAASVAWNPLGWETAAVAEVNPMASAVLDFRFPGVPNLGDVTKVDGYCLDELGRLDLMVFGWPCQDLSLAGNRKGLAGIRSGLFYEATRILRLVSDRGCRWFVAENVPGLLSSGRGRDFAEVIREISGLTIPVPRDGWLNGGVVARNGEGWSFAWRVLDARYFGCAASRKRIYIVGHYGNWKGPAAVLFERYGLQVDRGGDGKERGISSTRVDRSRPPSQRAIALTDRKREGGRKLEWRIELGYSPLVRKGGGNKTARQVVDLNGDLRCLTPRETERLLGFPDDWTLVPHLSGMLAETHRNACVGNSMAIPPMAWIGERLQAVRELAGDT